MDVCGGADVLIDRAAQLDALEERLRLDTPLTCRVVIAINVHSMGLARVIPRIQPEVCDSVGNVVAVLREINSSLAFSPWSGHIALITDRLGHPPELRWNARVIDYSAVDSPTTVMWTLTIEPVKDWVWVK